MSNTIAKASQDSESMPTPEWAPCPPTEHAHVISSDEEAIAIAENLRLRFLADAGSRDKNRTLPFEEVDVFSQSGLWGITIPKNYGGAGVSQTTVAKVFTLLASADASLAQMPQSNFEIIDVIRLTGSEEQKRDLFGMVLAGQRLGNAFSEFKGKNVEDFETRLVRDGDEFLVSGQKFYSTGALFAHLVPIVALDEGGHVVVAVADRTASGLTVVDDWSGFGQRTTASGTVLLDSVRVAASRVLPAHIVYEKPSAVGPQSQIIHAAIDLGIAKYAIDVTIDLIKTYARPWIDSGRERASDDPYTIAAVGDLKIKYNAAEAMLERSGRQLDATIANVDERTIGLAKIAIAEAKVLSTELALLASNKLFELVGARSTLEKLNLDRLWRDARTHTLHDPVRWKFHAIGQYYLNEIEPPIHSWI
ncbi:SfnB family sulfur acquisition oxidoreductase [Rhizobium laguerreae]|uniref:SfnB family sulfur acquisition oxidoreductase n=1 Tax=Rhizobium laguerreae TaxID=1076926 RepID=A0AAX2QF62_9HYPH|nr:SfnB family sulfur acquisition oxidoreductase [Rhizobium laguerreae]MBY3280129.1 SfnB family sulfur acquisition oxidoreductase [Rhizobium laguerreae]MBY3422424.1 SfnB family sulfur acquisition oxidoreductase [Rhizobium laguerreae]MBY3473430.1 SfnB family sulfur acquisition oxidoreductase [Rhizobium laguerreae]MBY3522914.1 SfnB family sulfur acquisition oxidoreductase [Rhizobium laguerreae]MBY3530150.1 SfnB family sulfur acquisition oxidoreductase [Rhizobium laguerreae]